MSGTEKITINLGLVDLGQIDLLVQEGFYSNRTDFIRTAIRNQLATHAEEVRQTVARKTLVLGMQHYTRRDLEEVREAGETLEIKVLGLASIDDDVDPELARETIGSLTVLGALRASRAVRGVSYDPGSNGYRSLRVRSRLRSRNERPAECALDRRGRLVEAALLREARGFRHAVLHIVVHVHEFPFSTGSEFCPSAPT